MKNFTMFRSAISRSTIPSTTLSTRNYALKATSTSEIIPPSSTNNGTEKGSPSSSGTATFHERLENAHSNNANPSKMALEMSRNNPENFKMICPSDFLTEESKKWNPPPYAEYIVRKTLVAATLEEQSSNGILGSFGIKKLPKDVRLYVPYQDIQKRGGKSFIARSNLVPIKESEALKNCTGYDMDRKSVDLLSFIAARSSNSKVKILTISGSTDMVASFIKPISETYPQVPVIHLFHYDKLYKYLLYPFIFDAVRKSFPDSDSSNLMVNFSGLEEFLTDYNVLNRFAGHIYLLDEQNRIRWFAHSYATPFEIQVLKTLIPQLA